MRSSNLPKAAHRRLKVGVARVWARFAMCRSAGGMNQNVLRRFECPECSSANAPWREAIFAEAIWRLLVKGLERCCRCSYMAAALAGFLMRVASVLEGYPPLLNLTEPSSSPIYPLWHKEHFESASPVNWPAHVDGKLYREFICRTLGWSPNP